MALLKRQDETVQGISRHCYDHEEFSTFLAKRDRALCRTGLCMGRRDDD